MKFILLDLFNKNLLVEVESNIEENLNDNYVSKKVETVLNIDTSQDSNMNFQLQISVSNDTIQQKFCLSLPGHITSSEPFIIFNDYMELNNIDWS